MLSEKTLKKLIVFYWGANMCDFEYFINKFKDLVINYFIDQYGDLSEDRGYFKMYPLNKDVLHNLYNKAISLKPKESYGKDFIKYYKFIVSNSVCDCSD